ncbi:MAG: polyribonucleotide nucleotidyltransferase [Patescibacteria group bacterium]
MEAFKAEVGGRELTIETGKYAAQANGACTVRYGDTVVLATAVISDNVRDGIDYFPLMVDYEERLYAAGKIKGSRFIKREGRPTDEAVLTARLIDRSLRPLFDPAVRNDVQVVVTVLSVDQENDPDVISLIAASTALMISNIPWAGPIGAVTMGLIGGEWVTNPTHEAAEKSDLLLFLSGTEEKVVMIEAEGAEFDEAAAMEAIASGQKNLKVIVELIKEVQKKVGVEKTTPDVEEITDEEKAKKNGLEKKVKTFIEGRLKDVLLKTSSKAEKEEAVTSLKHELDNVLKEDNEVTKELRAEGVVQLEQYLDEEARRLVLEEDKRVDGRKLDEIRPLSVEVGILPRTHGSGLFNRGETQVLSIITLGSPGDEQILDTMEESGKKRYMHHYNFPGFSVGEAKPLRGPSRRDIGHGALAEKALIPVLPDQVGFPYTIRVVSEVLSSNGSSSQASVCGSSLALMDAGVPIARPVAGIAMGLVYDEAKGNYKILTDIQGVEDHAGDMDFKVAGTEKGITAIQLDIKVSGLTLDICREALAGAKKARLEILEIMKKAISEPRKELSQYAPRIEAIKINPDLIRTVIGSGGETINKIIEECGGKDITKIDIEDDGTVLVTSTDADMSAKAIKWIKDITREIKVGEVFDGTVTQIMSDRNSGKEIGAIVEITPGKDGMVHISEFSHEHIASVSDVVKVGDKLKVKVRDVDNERGRISLSVKALDESGPLTPGDFAGNDRPPRRPRPMPRRNNNRYRR